MRAGRMVTKVLLLCWVLFCWVGCSSGQRRCVSDEDCANNAPKLTCLQGVCSALNCTPGKQQVCFEGERSVSQRGLCRPGVRFCQRDGTWSVCLGQVLPRAEICDRLDNDCNGQIDDLKDPTTCSCPTAGETRECYSGATASPLQGLCRRGVQYCETDFRWGRCLGQVLPQGEACDGLDNDCNGKIDDHPSCGCTPGAQQECYTGPVETRGIGLCKVGTQRCGEQRRWGACEGEQTPKTEASDDKSHCDGKDNDCDGEVDEDCPCQTSPNSCASGLACCATRCVNTQVDSAHCGGCGKACKAGETCESGICKGASCQSPQQRCGARCTDTSTSPLHCGACGKACSAGESCEGGICKQGCTPPTVGCQGECVNTATDSRHCGGCGKPCTGPSEICENGVCKASNCQSPEQACGERCVDTSVDVKHCGGCDKACAVGEACLAGKCGTCNKMASVEICPNGKDDDCDGKLDRDCVMFSAGNAEYDQINDIAVDAQGRIYILGHFRGTLSFGSVSLKTDPPTALENPFVIALSAQESLLWVRQVKGDDVTAHALALDGKGGVYITGEFTKTARLGANAETAKGLRSGFLAKLTSGGALQWVQYLHTSANQFVFSQRVVASSGGVVVTGGFSGQLKIGATTISGGSSNRTLFLAKYDTAGTAQWAFEATQAHQIKAPVLALDAQDNIYIAGSYTGSMTLGTKQLLAATQQAHKGFVAKFDKLGNVLWASIPTGQDFQVKGLALDDTGAIYITGLYEGDLSIDNQTLPSTGAIDAFLMRADPQGKFTRATAFSNGNETTGEHLLYVPTTKRLVLLGSYRTQSLKIDNKTIPNRGNHDLFLATFDLAGKNYALEALNDTQNMVGNGLAIGINGDAYAFGVFFNELQFRGASIKGKGSGEGFWVRFQP